MNDHYWKCEYENLRRKKNKECEIYLYKMASLNAELYEFLDERGLIEDWYDFKRNHKNRS